MEVRQLTEPRAAESCVRAPLWLAHLPRRKLPCLTSKRSRRLARKFDEKGEESEENREKKWRLVVYCTKSLPKEDILIPTSIEIYM